MSSTGCLTDGLGRAVSYLRLSVTDRCNLRCLYCRSDDLDPFLPHASILRYEELVELVDAAVSMNIRKVRLTGGEPFARRDFLSLVAAIANRHPGLDLRLTTNGTMLGGHVAALRDLGVRAINLSLDTLDRERFARVTGQDRLDAVLSAMDEVLATGVRLKINAVALAGINDDELPAFLDLARTRPIDVRFIEFMPMGDNTRWTPAHYWSAGDILETARTLADLAPAPRDREEGGPARMFTVGGGLGRFGVISPLSDHFCGTCNRLRITPDGRLRTCLFSDREYRLRPLLRHPRLGIAAVRKVIEKALARKPLGYELLRRAGQDRPAARKRMSAIGG